MMPERTYEQPQSRAELGRTARFVDGIGFVDSDGHPLPVIPLSFYYGQDRNGWPWCELHDVVMGGDGCRCKP